MSTVLLEKSKFEIIYTDFIQLMILLESFIISFFKSNNKLSVFDNLLMKIVNFEKGIKPSLTNFQDLIFGAAGFSTIMSLWGLL